MSIILNLPVFALNWYLRSHYQLAIAVLKRRLLLMIGTQEFFCLTLDDFEFYYRTDIDRLIDQILLEEPLISEARKPQLKKLIEKLIEKQQEN